MTTCLVEPCKPADPFGGVTLNDLLRVQRALDGKDARENHQAGDWAGYAVAEVLDLDPHGDKRRIRSLLHIWIKNGALRVVKRPDEKSRERPVVEVGEWATE